MQNKMRREDAFKLWSYVGLTLALFMAFAVAENVTWPFGNTQLHTIMEVVATLLALMVGFVALVRYYAKRHNMILFLGIGFIGTALLDGYHAVVSSSIMQPHFPSKDFSLIPWSWNASRTFLAVLMVMSWLAWRREKKLGEAGRISELAIYAGTAVLTLASFVFFVFAPLGPAYFPDFMFGRPEEFVAGAFFLVALVGYLSKQDWRHDPLEHWIINSLIIGFLCQTIFMSRSYGLFDSMFDMAHFLKIVSYAMVFVGLLADISATWQREQRMLAERASALAWSTEELEFAYVAAKGDIQTERDKSAIVRETGDEAAGIDSFDEALDLWARQARSIVGAHQSAVSFIPHGSFGNGKHALSMSEKYDAYKSYDVLPNGDGIWRLIVHEKLSFCMTDEELTSHPAWKNFSDLRSSSGLEHPPMRGWLAVPVLSDGRDFVGVLQLTDKYEGDFTQQDLERLTRLGQLMAPAFSLHYANEEVQLRSEELAVKAVQLEEQRQTAVTLAEELKKADQAKSQFLANMSHEIRTPMNAVMGLTELVLQSQLDDIQRDYLSTVMDSADSLLSIINDILDFSKIEAGMMDVEQVQFRLHDVVADTVRSLALRAQRKDLELACFVDPELPEVVQGDPGRLRQILTNLLGNAIKFTHAGEVVVRVVQESENEGSPIVKFLVQDSGIGIPADQLGAIFESFAQADASTTREFGGTGLGLAICERLVGLLGGQIGVESEPGKGSTFWFTAKLTVSESEWSRASMPAELVGTRVLVVDDNATNCLILEQILVAKKMAPVTAPSALDGYNLLQDALREGKPIRVLISDVHMPQMDGYGLAEMIRADAKLADLDIIFLSSAGSPGNQQRCEKLRVSAQMMKPVKQSELYNILIRTLGVDTEQQNGWLALAQATPTTLPALRILLVEDSVANQKVALAIMSGGGHSIVVANHGQEALSILEEQEFDVILMDVQMPVMDGLAATAAIRAKEAGIDEHQPIVAMTAHAMTGDRERCLEAGMDEYVSKPIRLEPLCEAIAAAVGIELMSGSLSGVLKSAAPEKLVDWTGPLGQLGGDHAILKEITQSYFDETHENLALLLAAISEGNARETTRLAHTIKGAMRFFSAETATQCGQQLEDQAETGDLSPANELFEQLKLAVDCVLPLLQRFIDTGEM